MKFKRAAAIGMLATMTIGSGLLTGCGNQNAASSAPEESKASEASSQVESTPEASVAKDSIIVGVSTDCGEQMNVHLYGYNMTQQNLIFEGLVENSNDGIIPALATSWDVSEDGKTYTFHLREGVKFTDGEPFNAEAVKANFDALEENKERHAWVAFFANYAGCKVVDEYTVEISMTEPYYPILDELAMIRPFRMMSPKSFIDGSTKDGVKYIAGTGAYTWEADSFEAGQTAVLKANEDYWAGAPALKTITFKVLPSGQTALQALYNHEIDFMFGSYSTSLIEYDALENLMHDSNFQVQLSDPVATEFLLVNSDPNRVVSDKSVRMAMSYAINREEMCEHLYNGMSDPAYTMFSKDRPYCDIDLKPYGYDVEKAKQLLEDDGYKLGEDGIYEKDGKRLSFGINYKSTIATDKTTCEYLQASLKEVGMELTLNPVDPANTSNEVKVGNYDLSLEYTWGPEYDPLSTVAAYREGSTYYHAIDAYDFAQDFFDTFNSVTTETDEAKRQEMWTKLLTTMHEEYISIPLAGTKLNYVSTPDLKGQTFFSQNAVDFRTFYYE